MPHMHVRGKDMTYHLVYPDGRDEIVAERAELRLQLAAALSADEADSHPEGHEDVRRRALRQLDGEQVQSESEPDGRISAG